MSISPETLTQAETVTQAPSAHRERSLATAPLFLLWAAAIALSPVYLFSAGSAQPSHVLFAGFLALSATCYFAPLRVDQTIWLLAGLWLFDVAVVNAVWWIATMYRDDYFLWTTAFHVFNVGVMLCTASLAMVAPQRFDFVTRVALGLAIIYEIAFAFSGAGQRSEGTFNNPNQLGYWSILVGTCWLAMKPREPLRPLDLAALAGIIVLAMASASRAALAGTVGLLVVAVLWHRPSPRMIPAVAVVLFACAIVAFATADQWLSALDDTVAVKRLDKDGPADSFEGRGYGRIWEYPFHTLVGAGEGYYARFTGVVTDGGEIHSTFGNIVFSYGLIGTVLFSAFVWRIFRPAGIRYLALAAPAALYGLAHQGLRTTLLWVFFGIVMARRWN